MMETTYTDDYIVKRFVQPLLILCNRYSRDEKGH